MRGFTVCVATAVLLLAAPTFAKAADMLDLPAADETAIEAEPEVGSNWYLRGDIGYVHATDLSIDSNFGTYGSVERDDTITLGGGMGYDFGWFRADITGDYAFDGNLQARRSSDPCDADATLPGATCSARDSVDLNVFTTLVNGYFDLGTWSGLTPYVGAGVGLAYVDFNGPWSTRETCTTTGDACPDGNTTATSYQFANSGASTWRLAWALNAGASYALSPNVALDVGYRLVGIDDGDAVATYRSFGGINLGKVEYSDLYNQEVRVGFRYTID